ncbi:hypothetical protein Sjap_015548 [Stephania japonica]|uniref:Uncharacterized protein n=1 Tax=Stephania japonica TaxID=461633 RepID=A0AAP0IJB4_9MAGN
MLPPPLLDRNSLFARNSLQVSAGKVREEARRAAGGDGGSSRSGLEILVEMCSNGSTTATSKTASTESSTSFKASAKKS